MKDTFYFTHDYNARTDVKIKRLLTRYGLAGYGLYWSIVEDLYNNANALPTDYESIAYDLRCECDMVKSVINDFDLFIFDSDTFGSLSVQRRLDERNEKSTKARKSALKRWVKPENDANAMQTHSEGNAIKERKGKEKKENESILPFETFWNLYEKHGNKKTSETKYRKISEANRYKIANHVKLYIASTPEKQFRKHAETYINQECWNDEIKQAQPQTEKLVNYIDHGTGHKHTCTEEQFKTRLRDDFRHNIERINNA